MDFEVYVAEVLDIVDAIPAGRVMAYGEVAHCLGRGGPRQVGRVMAVHGGAVAWWRVIRADGQAAQGLERAALKQWRAEGTPLRADGRRVDMARARWAGEPSDLG